MKKLLLLVTLTLGLLVGCESSVYGQDTYKTPNEFFKNGVCYKGYNEKGCVLIMCVKTHYYAFIAGKKVVIDLAIENKTPNSINFNPDKIAVYGYNKKGKRFILKLFNFEEYEKILKRNIMWFAPGNTAKVETKTKGNSGDNNVDITTSTTVYTGARDDVYSDAESHLERYLRMNTIYTDEMYDGFVVTDNYNGKVIDIELIIDNKVFCFKFNIKQK